MGHHDTGTRVDALSTVHNWIETFEAYAADWAVASLSVVPDEWDTSFDAAQRAHEHLVSTGRWLSGPRSLLGVLGIRRREVHHSAILAWLLNPTGRHGLAAGLLERVLVRVGLPADLAAGRVDVTTEERCEHPYLGDAGYVDVIVRGSDWALVIENKIWSRLHGRQLDVYHAAHQGERTRFAFLTPSGIPAYAHDPGVAEAYHPLSWRRDMIPDLGAAIAAVPTGGYVPVAAIDYLNSLEEEFL